MGQAGIPMINKVGHSMFWNSMWDNKVNYTANLCEDIFLKKFIPLIFKDNSSFRGLNVFNLDPKKLKIAKVKYRLHVNINLIGKKKNSFFKYINKLKKVEFYFSRIWILKYQKWVVIYLYIYIPKFSKLKKIEKFSAKFIRLDSLYSNYNYASNKIKYSYSNANAYKETFVF